MPAPELTVRRALADDGASNRGLQSWQIIYPNWNTLYFQENGGGGVCTAVLPGTFPHFYASGADLAGALTTAMNGASCTVSLANTYAVTYSAATGRFSFAVTAGTRSFQLRPADTPNNITAALGGLPTTVGSGSTAGGPADVVLPVSQLRRTTTGGRVRTGTTPHGVAVGNSCTIINAAPTYWNATWTVTQINTTTEFMLNGPSGVAVTATNYGTVTCTVNLPAAPGTAVQSPASYTLLYRTTGTGTANTLAAPFRDGLDTRWTFTEAIATVNTNFYQVATSRLWNGETIRVDANGAVCGMDFAATKTSPPSVTVQLADASCNPITGTAVFTYAGGSFSRSGDGCRGFRSKSDLIPCDLQSPPAPQQIVQVSPYVDDELPTGATGDPADLTTNGAAYGTADYGVPDGVPDYLERQDGSWAVQSIDVAPSAKATGYTPIANSPDRPQGPRRRDQRLPHEPRPAGGQARLRSPRAATVGACVQRGFSQLWTPGPDRQHDHGRSRALAARPHHEPQGPEGEDDRPVRDGR